MFDDYPEDWSLDPDKPVTAPCCGDDRDYCECPVERRARAALVALARLDCPPVTGLAVEDSDPPF